MTKKTELYVANQIIKGEVLDRPATNGKGESGYLIFSSYYISKKLVLIVKYADNTYSYINGEECYIINPKKLNISHEIIKATTFQSNDTVIGVTNLIPVKRFIKDENLDKIKAYIEEYNKIVDDNYYTIDKKTNKSVIEKINSNKKIKSLVRRKIKRKNSLSN